ncbi:MAG: hypothetical protein WDN72_04090 [Alphaproteobacteria bacterium]
METLIVRAGDTDERSAAFRQAYYALRSKAFDTYWGQNFYPNGPDAYDLRPDTVFLLAVEDGKVIAGNRLLFHEPGSDVRLPLEDKHPKLLVENLLPHLDVKGLRYCESGGGIADPDEVARHPHLGTEASQARFRLIQSGKLGPIDAVFATLSSSSVGALERAATATA